MMLLSAGWVVGAVLTGGTLGSDVDTVATKADASPTNLSPIWLSPNRFDAKAGEDVRVSLSRGVGAEAKAVKPTDAVCEWAFLRLRGVQENRDSLTLLSGRMLDANGQPKGGVDKGIQEGTDQTVQVRLERDGVAVIACDLAPTEETIELQTLKDVLTPRLRESVAGDLDTALGTKEQVKIRRFETSKCLVRVSKNDGSAAPVDAQTVITKAGQRNEIRFTMDPTRLPIGADLQFRVFAEYDKAAKARVIATCDEAGVRQEIDVSPSATGYVRLAHEGTWRVEFTSIAFPKNDTSADVVIYSATAIFRTKPSGAEIAPPATKRSDAGTKEVTR